MSEKTTNYDLEKPEMTDLVSEYIPLLSDSLDTVDTELYKAENHRESTGAHNATSIPYAGEVSGASNISEAVNELKSQLDAAIVGSGTSPAEVTSAREGIRGESNATLNTRLDKSESLIGKTTTISESTILTDDYRGTILVDTTSGAVEIVLPTISSTNLQLFRIKKIQGDYSIYINCDYVTDNIDGFAGTMIVETNESKTFLGDGGTTWHIINKQNRELNYFNVLDYCSNNAIWDGSTNCYSALNSIKSVFPSDGGTIYFPSTSRGAEYYLNTSFTLPDNCKLKFDNGATMTINTGKTLTGVDTKVDVGLEQIFTVNGSIDGTWIIGNYFVNQTPYNPSNITSGSQVTTTVTVTGAQLGHIVDCSFSIDLQGLIMTAYVSSANTVTVIFANLTGGDINLGSGNIVVRVYKDLLEPNYV